ncbi:MAG: putative zinc-binding metallopeptidase, partial [Chitinophagaceae bacterium]
PMLLPSLAGAEGFFTHSISPTLKFLGYHESAIYIPRWVVVQPWIFGEKTCIRDIIRHEYAHAFQECYPKKIKPRAFEKVFGGSYYNPDAKDFRPKAYVSKYAASMPMEDFAETFMYFLKYKGNCPRQFNRPIIQRKWQYINQLLS